MTRTQATLLAVGLLLAAASALAQDTLKIGIILPYSGQFADPAAQMDNAIKLWVAQNGDEVAGKKIEFIRKDVGGIAPPVAKRLAQELVVRDHVDIIGGLLLTPNALAVADVATEAKKLTVIMNAATAIITTKSPYMVRTSATVPQIVEAFGTWAYKQGLRKAYTMVADYGPGHDAENGFHHAFQAEGGEIVGSVRMPVRNPDFSAFVQRAKDVGPEGIFIFIPGGTQPAALGKSLAERGITPRNTKIMGMGELTEDEARAAMGDASIGILTAYHYDHNHDSAMNRAFVKAFNAAYGGRNPNIYSVGGWDGMHLIYEALRTTGGDTDGEALIAAVKGMQWESPRGPIMIDPETRDIVQTVYIREVRKVDGELVNVEIDAIPNVKDPVKARMK